MTPEQERLVQAMLQEQAPPGGQPQEGRGWRNVAAAGELALGALPFTRIGRAMFSTIPRALGSAAGIGGAGATAQHLVAPAEAAEPDQLGTARETIGKLRKNQEKLQTDLATLESEAKRFDTLRTGDTDAVRQAQEFLSTQGLYGRRPDGSVVRPDGRWGEGTRVAIDAFRQRNTTQQAAVRRQLQTLGSDLEAQGGRLTGLEGGERLREAERNVDPFSSVLRKGGEIGGTVAGLALGTGLRIGAVRGSNAKALGRARVVEAMLSPKTTAVAPRAGRLAEVWRRGGQGANPPFVNAPGTAHGVAPNPAAAATGQLFPGRPGIRGQVTGTDASIMAGLGAEGGVAEYRRYLAEHEVAEAHAAARQDPSEVNIARLQRAMNDAAFWQSLARVGQAGALSYGVASTKTPRLYPQPNLSRADAEVANLNRLIAPPPPKPAPRKRKK